MKKTAIIIAILVVIGGGIAMAVWLMSPQPTSTVVTTDDQSGLSKLGTPEQPATGEVSVHIRDSSFVPANLTVKKGTKVTWVNDDTTQHNIVADDSANAGGLPTQNSLLGKGASYSFTFNTVGIFDYHCTPHPFMTGTVSVVE